jgi:predicted metal-dependent hydrolase
VSGGGAGPPALGPALDAAERALLEKGVHEFNARLFFECHDTLEELWSGRRDASRDFYQGLIQAAVGFYHLGNRNHEGARRLFERALARLRPYPEAYAGLDTAPLRAALARFRDALAAGSPPPPEGPPTLRLG